MTEKICRICKKKFKVFPYQEKKAFYCSIPCSRVGQWKYHKDTMLEHLLKTSQPLAAKSRTGAKLSKKSKDQISKNRKGKYTGDENNKWMGDSVGYLGVHSWVQRKKGKADRCDMCLDKSFKRYHWANIDHSYKRDVDDYISMCPRCHRNYDLIFNNKKNGRLEK